MRPATVQIVGPTDQWVLQNLAQRLASKLPYAEFVGNKPADQRPSGLMYFVNYALFHKPTHHIDVGFFTHLENETYFLAQARAMDHAICMSKIYADWLRSQGVEAVTHVPTGFEFYRYRPRLVLGVVGLLQHPRKGKRLVDYVRSLDFVEIKVTDGTLSENELAGFYQSLDYVLIPALVEGGPMSLLEGLGCGKPIIAPESVGMVPEFTESPHIRRYPTGDELALKGLLETCFREKLGIASLVAGRTLDDWAKAHDAVFRQLFKEHGIRFQNPAPGFRFGMMGELQIPLRCDVRPIEAAVDKFSSLVYFGDYSAAKESISVLVPEFACLEPLIESIPS